MRLPISQIKPNPSNPRQIRDDKFKKLVQSLKDFPEMAEVREVVVNKDHMILGGNMRFKAMQEAGWTEIPVKVVDWTPEQQREFIIKDNLAMGEWSWDDLANSWDQQLLDDWGLDVPGGFGDDEVEEDEAPEVSTDPPISKLGEIYELGRHRVMCGDSTDKASVELLMDGEKANMVFTDPPYGIDVVSGTADGSKPFGSDGASNVVEANQYSQIIGDDTTDSAKKHFELCKELGITKYLLWGGNYFTDFLPPKKCWIVWDKKGREWNDNFSDFEMAWTSLDKPAKIFTHTWMGMVQSGEREQRVHPTQKPAKLIADCLNYVEAGSVFDGFLGSGSTLIACEQTDRICFGMEIDPKYTDVIRKRYAKFVNNNELPDNWEELTPAITVKEQ